MSVKQRVDAFFPAETPIERAKALEEQREQEKQIIEKIKESHAKLSFGSGAETLKDISFYKQLEDLTKELKKKSLAVSERKLEEYD